MPLMPLMRTLMPLTALQLFWFGRERNRTLQVGTYLAALIFYVGINIKTQTQHTTKHPHHGELPPPPAARILWLDPIRRKPDAGEGLGEGAVEAIQLNR